MVLQKNPKMRDEDPNVSSDEGDLEDEQRRELLRQENELLRAGTMYLFLQSLAILLQTYFTVFYS